MIQTSTPFKLHSRGSFVTKNLRGELRCHDGCLYFKHASTVDADAYCLGEASDEHVVEITRVLVKERSRDCGRGTDLIQYFLEWARTQGYGFVALQVWPLDKKGYNTCDEHCDEFKANRRRLANFYTRLGFKFTGERKDYLMVFSFK